MWVRLTPGPLLVATSLACASAAYEQLDQPAGDTIGFEEAIGYTLERNPGLVAFGYQLDAQRGRLQQSALKPNLELDMELENAAGSGPFSGMGAAEATISLVWVLERGKRERRVDVAQAGLSLLESEAEIGRLDAAAATARLYLESLANQLLTEKADEAVRFGERTVEAVRERVGAGRTPAAELSRAEARLSEQRLIREDYRHRLRTSLRQLAAQWGDTNPSFKGVVETNASIPEPIAYEPLLQKIERNPSLTRFLSERRLREAEVRLAETRAKPDWRVSAGVRHLELTGDQALLARIRIPLPARNRNQGLIAEARAALAMTEADRRASRIEIETRLFAVYRELEHSLHVATTLRDDILPKVERALLETQRAYEAGRYGYLELQSAQDAALEARTAAVVAVVDANRNLIEIERLTGTAVSAPIVRR